MRKHQKRDQAPSHRNRHDHQHNPLEEQEPGGSRPFPTLDINTTNYVGHGIPRSLRFPENPDFNNQDSQPSSHYIPEVLEGYPPGPSYVFTEEAGRDLVQGIDSDEEDPNAFPYPTHAQAGYDDDDDDTTAFDYDTRQAIAQSLDQVYQPHDANQPSTSALQNHFDPYLNSSPQPSYDEQTGYEHSETPRPQHLSPNYIASFGNKDQKMTDEFAIVPSTRFRFGTVFKVNWFEPRGGARTAESEVTDDVAGDPYFSGVRRFIVVKEARGHSLCVGIYTYGRQGCLKRGVHPEHHAQAYDEREPVPYLLHGEPRLGSQPIPVTISPQLQWETIDSRSRINLAKLHTINHNVPVSIIGMVASNFHQYLRNCINTLFRSQDVPRHHGTKGKDKGKGKERRR